MRFLSREVTYLLHYWQCSCLESLNIQIIICFLRRYLEELRRSESILTTPSETKLKLPRKHFLCIIKFWETTWMVLIVLSCLSTDYTINRITGKSHGVLVQSEAAYSLGTSPPNKDSGCSPWTGSNVTLLLNITLPLVRGTRVPHNAKDVLRAVNTPLCSVDTTTSFLLGINIRDDTYSSQQGLFFWRQQMLVQAFAASFSNDTLFHFSSVNCIYLE